MIMLKGKCPECNKNIKMAGFSSFEDNDLEAKNKQLQKENEELRQKIKELEIEVRRLESWVESCF